MIFSHGKFHMKKDDFNRPSFLCRVPVPLTIEKHKKSQTNAKEKGMLKSQHSFVKVENRGFEPLTS